MNFSYIGRKKCGCIVAAVVDDEDSKKATAKVVAKWIREGLAIERVSVEYVRKNFKHCPHEAAQIHLDAADGG